MSIFNYKIPKPVFIGSAVATTFGVACLIKEWVGGPHFRADILATDKVILITGANTGIGKETAWELARRGAKVYMACRNMKKCEAAREEIVLDTKNKNVYCRECDLASFQSIRKFVDKFKSEQKRLDVLINNAGVMRPPYSKTKEGIEMQLGVNHMGHFLLTNLLLDLLTESAPSRIVNVSSLAHKRGKINREDLNSEKEYDASKAYAQSKLANILFTQELSKKLQGDKICILIFEDNQRPVRSTKIMEMISKPTYLHTPSSYFCTGVTVNAVHPGIVDTEIIRHMGFYNSWFATIFIKPFIWPFIKNPKQGSFTPVYVALSPKLNNVTGKYYSNCEEEEVGPSAQDPATSAWLWAVSERWTRLFA